MARLPGRGSFEVQGHRGARGLFPENTLEGFRGALAIGVRAFELDVGMTSDDVVVVSHDPALNPDITRDASGAWLAARGPLLRQLTRSELARYDVGRIRPASAYAALHPDQTPCDGARIPTLAAVLDIGPDVRFTIELKTDPAHPDWTVDAPALAEAVLAVVDEAGAADRVMIESFDWRGPRHVRALRPELRLAWLTRAGTVRAAGFWWGGPHPADFGGSVPRAVAAEGGAVWAPEHNDLTEDLIAEAHALGLTVLPWTVNRPADMRRLIDWGIDGLITDRPDLARHIIAPVPPTHPN
ncbi:MAG TPA: glycerophosphodiester phosphodiesterase [Acetobacteraceae bacterium]